MVVVEQMQRGKRDVCFDAAGWYLRDAGAKWGELADVWFRQRSQPAGGMTSVWKMSWTSFSTEGRGKSMRGTFAFSRCGLT